ncbi:MAG: hypothetical protein PHU85_09215, partial [Phycisphaerae bacterium]|nr:hypothetical protein [Phycisphaerae bacterium]
MKHVMFVVALLGLVLTLRPTPSLAQVRPPTPATPAGPVTADPKAAELLRRVEACRVVAADARRPDDERSRAANDAIAALDELEARQPADPRVFNWRVDKVNMLVDGLIDPSSKRIMYELATPTDRDKAQKAVDEAEKIIQATMPNIAKAIEDLENKAAFETPEYRRLEPLKNQLEYQKTLVTFYRAQLVWSKLCMTTEGMQRLGHDPALMKDMRTVKDFFEPFASEDDANLRIPSM